jgi:drug/metabolite transporter (DMT)-like permease
VPDRLVTFTLIGASCSVGGVILVLAAPAPDKSSWTYVGASAALHIAYQLLLMRSYKLGDFGHAYPLARGSSVLLVALAAAVVVGEHLSGVRLIGVLVVSGGLAALVFSGGAVRRREVPAIAAALATGVTIAAYTTLDGLGVRHSGSVLGYTGWLFLLQGPAVPLFAMCTRGRDLPRQLRPHLLVGLVGGVLSIVAYGLVLWAQTHGALAPIAALRETSVVIGAMIGAVIFHEPFGRYRVVATLVITTGVVLTNL